MALEVSEVLSILSKAASAAIREGFDDAAFVASAGRTSMAKFANNSITVVQSWHEVEVEVYLSKGSKIYATELTLSSSEDLERVVGSVKKIIDKLEDAELSGPLPQPTGRPLSGLADKRTAELLDSVAELGEHMVSEALSAYPRGRAAGMVEVAHGYRMVVTSRGAELVEEHTSVEAYVRVLGPEGEPSGHWAWCGRRADLGELASAARTAASYAAEKLPKASVEPGRYAAILSPLVVGNLLGDTAWMASALAVIMGFSFFAKHKPGSRVASESLTLYDAPRDTALPGSTGFDDEGVETKNKAIIEKGVVKTLLHNTKTARREGTETTGNAGLITPHPWNIVVEPGNANLEEMIAEVKRGLLVLNNWYTRFQNYYEGQFSTVTRDMLIYIENGEKKGWVTRLRIADYMPNLLKNIALIGKEPYSIKWWEVPFPTKTPYILVSETYFTTPK